MISHLIAELETFTSEERDFFEALTFERAEGREVLDVEDMPIDIEMALEKARQIADQEIRQLALQFYEQEAQVENRYHPKATDHFWGILREIEENEEDIILCLNQNATNCSLKVALFLSVPNQTLYLAG